jgi:beta-lactamase class D
MRPLRGQDASGREGRVDEPGFTLGYRPGSPRGQDASGRILRLGTIAALTLAVITPASAETTLKDLAASQAAVDALVKPALGKFEGCVVIQVPAQKIRLVYNAPMASEEASPCSTFKIPNTLIGLDTGVLSGPDHVFKWDGKERSLPVWNHDHTLKEAFRNSTVWYYQELARQIGPERMQKYVDGFDYGNTDISGGIDQFWLGNTLKISAADQVRFLIKLRAGKLPVSQETYVKARQVFLLDERGAARLYAKTGTDGDLKTGKFTMGWFVGWLEPQMVFFAIRITGGEGDAWGKEARRIMEGLLTETGYWPAAKPE